MTFEGDLLLKDGLDGGFLTIKDGEFLCDKTFATAVYLSLFGGNIEDEGFSDASKQWWGNIGEAKGNALRSQFQAFITAKPLTTKNLRTAKDCALSDLQWIIDEGAADAISIKAAIEGEKRAAFEVELTKDGETLEKCVFKAQWDAMQGGD